MPPLLIYLHGFLSSPAAQKAQELQEYLHQHAHLAVDFLAPAIAAYPAQAIAELQQCIRDEQQQGRQSIGLVGSSLGGFYARCLVEAFQLRAVLINPAVQPYQLLRQRLGEHENPYSGEPFCLTEQHMLDLKSLEPLSLQHPEHYLVMLQTGDEVLDYRAAQQHYRHSPQIVEAGGNHRFADFKKHIPDVLQFLKCIS